MNKSTVFLESIFAIVNYHTKNFTRFDENKNLYKAEIGKLQSINDYNKNISGFNLHVTDI